MIENSITTKSQRIFLKRLKQKFSTFKGKKYLTQNRKRGIRLLICDKKSRVQ